MFGFLARATRDPRGTTRCTTFPQDRCREHETYAGRSARCAALVAVRVARSPPASALCLFAPQPSTHSFAETRLARHRCSHRFNARRAWPGRGANKAQAPAVDGPCAQRPYERAARAYRATRTFHARGTCLSGTQCSECGRAGRKTASAGIPVAGAKRSDGRVAIAPRPAVRGVAARRSSAGSGGGTLGVDVSRTHRLAGPAPPTERSG